MDSYWHTKFYEITTRYHVAFHARLFGIQKQKVPLYNFPIFINYFVGLSATKFIFKLHVHDHRFPSRKLLYQCTVVDYFDGCHYQMLVGKCPAKRGFRIGQIIDSQMQFHCQWFGLIGFCDEQCLSRYYMSCVYGGQNNFFYIMR